VDTPISPSEARFALSSIEQRHQQVIAAVNVPGWYWIGMAAGWVALGAVAEFAPPWATIVVTLLFGAGHSTIAPRVLTGRHPSRQVSIRPDLVNRRLPLLVIGFLLVLTAATVGIALVLNADGARHPALLASGLVALLVLSGGPALVAEARRRRDRV
jgi:hypothetical protein